MNYSTEYPVLDGPGGHANGRTIQDVFGYIEPFVHEMNTACGMPVRLVYDDTAGWHIELGPYSIIGADIATLLAAIAAYDHAASPAQS